MICDKKLHRVWLHHTDTEKKYSFPNLVYATFKHVSCYNKCTCLQLDLNWIFTHACTSKQLPDNKSWLQKQTESVIEYNEKERRLCERNRPLSSPSIRVLRFILPVLTHCPVNRLRPTAQLNATTCYPTMPTFSSMSVISSDKPNICGEFTPLDSLVDF